MIIPVLPIHMIISIISIMSPGSWYIGSSHDYHHWLAVSTPMSQPTNHDIPTQRRTTWGATFSVDDEEREPGATRCWEATNDGLDSGHQRADDTTMVIVIVV